MSDLYQQECYRTFESYGFFVDHLPDGAIKKFVNGKMVTLAHSPGRADNIILGDGYGCAVEVKTASGESYRRFAFDDPDRGWKPEQRKWADVWCSRGNTYWLFITFGERIGGKEWPRRTYLVQKPWWEELEKYQREQGKKSVNYDEMFGWFSSNELAWAGEQRWVIPDHNSFWIYVPRPIIKDLIIAE